MSWNQIIVVDALSREQLSGEVRPGRSPEVSVVLVQTSDLLENYHHSLLGKENRVLAKRMSVHEATRTIREPVPENYGLPLDHIGNSKRIFPQHYYESGVLLYDPEKQLYDKSILSSLSEDTQLRPIDQVLELKPTLPAEIAIKIRDDARSDIELEELTAAPAKFNVTKERLDIHALVPLEEGELKGLQERLNRILKEGKSENEATKKVDCVIHAWNGHKPATRYDTWRLWQRFHERHTGPYHSIFFFIGWSGWDPNSHEIGMIQWNYHELSPTRRISIERAAETWVAYMGGSHGGSDVCRNYEDPEFELFSNPRARFYYDPPPFVSLNEGDLFTAPVFYLTKHLTPDEDDIIIEELMTEDEADSGLGKDKDYTYVEWDQNEDGGEADIWRLLWQVASYTGQSTAYCALFIDKDSPIDNKVIVAVTRLVHPRSH